MTVNNLLISSLVPMSQNVDGLYGDILYCCVRPGNKQLPVLCIMQGWGLDPINTIDTLRLTCKLVQDSGKRERANTQSCLEK